MNRRATYGDAYVAAMELAGEYAYAGRDVVVDIGAGPAAYWLQTLDAA